MKDIYLISTFRHAWNREFNLRIASALEDNDFVCYFAHRDTDQAGTPEMIFQQDSMGLSSCRTALAIAENESVNWGAEVGMAYGLKIPIVALSQADHVIPIIANGMIKEHIFVDNLDDISGYIEKLRSALRGHLAPYANGNLA